MLGNTYSNQNCSAARTLELVGERWSLLILRDALFRGINHFNGFQESLGIATNILAKRLDGFIANGLMKYVARNGETELGIYVPTEKAHELKYVIVALTEWGDKWVKSYPNLIDFKHDACGGHVVLQAVCESCQLTVPHSEISTALKHQNRRK